MPLDLVVVAAGADFNPMEHGALRCVSPEEARAPFFRTICKDLALGDTTLEEWRTMAVSITVELLEGEDAIFCEAVSLRERLVANYQSPVRNAFQRAHEAARLRQRKVISLCAAASHKRIADEWGKRAQFAANSEEVTVGYIQKALTVFDRGLRRPSCSSKSTA